MNKKITAIEQIGNEILNLRYAFNTDELIAMDVNNVLSNWQMYASQYDKVQDFFESIGLTENEYLNRTIFRQFCKTYLAFIDKSAELAVIITKPEVFDGFEKIKSQYENEVTGHLERIKANNDFDSNIPELKKYEEVIKERSSAITGHDKKMKEKSKIPYHFFLFKFLNRFHQIFESCKSPLEKAFFIGLVTYEAFTDFWIFEEKFQNNFSAGEYKLDFAYVDKEKGIYIGIDLSDEEKINPDEEILEFSQKRDSMLKQQGWQIIKFYKNDIIEDLPRTIERVKQYYLLKEGHLGSYSYNAFDDWLKNGFSANDFEQKPTGK